MAEGIVEKSPFPGEIRMEMNLKAAAPYLRAGGFHFYAWRVEPVFCWVNSAANAFSPFALFTPAERHSYEQTTSHRAI
jgi:hypothetical protein